MISWNEVTAVFGGTFDPPHLGHIEAVRGLFSQPGVARVLVLPSPAPPHKPSFAPAEHRIEMARIAFGRAVRPPFPGEVALDLRELERARKSPERPTYSFDTLQELRRAHRQLAFVVGTDQLAALQTWYRFPDLLGLCHWIVLTRKPDGLSIAGNTLRDWESSGLGRRMGDTLWEARGGTLLTVVPTEARAVSSTAIREQISRTGSPPDSTLLPEVSSYLKLHRLYGSSFKEELG